MIKCWKCGGDSGWSEELFHSPLFGGNPNIPICDPCVDIAKEEYRNEQEAEKTRDTRQEPIEKVIPPLYLETDYHKLPKEAQVLWKSLKYWEPDSGKGVYILGNSRTGKTRTLTLLLKQLHSRGHHMKLFLAGQFHAALAEAKQSKHFTRWRDEMVAYPILAIDDLFSEKLTPSAQAGLFELIEQRMANKKPLLITTQVPRSDAIHQFDDPRRGEALMNRLKETTNGYLMDLEMLQDKMAI